MRVYSLKNPFWRYFGLALFFIGVAGTLGGTLGVVFFVIQALVAIVHLELANYIEHYGLRRKDQSILINSNPPRVITVGTLVKKQVIGYLSTYSYIRTIMLGATKIF